MRGGGSVRAPPFDAPPVAPPVLVPPCAGIDYVKDDSCSSCRNDDNLDYGTMWQAIQGAAWGREGGGGGGGDLLSGGLGLGRGQEDRGV